MSYYKVFKNLQDFITKTIVVSLARKTPFENDYIPLSSCISLLQLAYENGAILGYSRGNKIDILKNMLSMQDMSINSIMDMQKAEVKLFDDFKKKYGEEPNTFADFIYWPLWDKYTGLNLETLFKPYENETNDKSQKKISNLIRKKLNEKILIYEVESKIRCFLIKGLFFGCAFPDLTAKMYNNVYICKSYDEDLWKITSSLGFATPIDRSMRILFNTDGYRPPTLKQSERVLLITLAFYTSRFHPELIDSLDLSYYFHLVKNKIDYII